MTAVLGPNGAGKTTFVRAVATLLRPDAGTLRRRRHRRRRPTRATSGGSIGLAGQHAAVEPALTGRENLVMVARLFGHDRAGGRRGRRRRCSPSSASPTPPTGSCAATRAACAGASTSAPASSARPRLLLLDEPTTGLDPRSRIELWDAIRALVAAGTDVLLTTQYLEEADQLADHVVIIDHGRAIATGTPERAEGPGRAGRASRSASATPPTSGAAPRLLAAARQRGGPRGRRAEPARRRRRRATARRDWPRPCARSPTPASTIDDVGLRRPTLDEVFLALTGRPATDDPQPSPTREPLPSPPERSPR